ncbi:MAG: nitronate monooxygenase [Chloroflexi bacterium]|nr:nitronate monooxygenase [Chloroflexota bacterium]
MTFERRTRWVVEPSLAVELGSLKLANPVMPASGCFGPGLAPWLGPNRLGALVTPTVSLRRLRPGGPRCLVETGGGLLVGDAAGPTVDDLVDDLLPKYAPFRAPCLVSLGGGDSSELGALAERLSGERDIAGFELNLAFRGVDGEALGSDPDRVERMVRAVVDRSELPVLAKLTSEGVSIADAARAGEAGGATALTVAASLPALAIDVTGQQAPVAASGYLCGPAARPLALALVRRVVRVVSIPVVGVGGVSTARDAVELLAVGARAVQVGTATLVRPDAMARIVDGIALFLRQEGIGDVRDLIGSLERGSIGRATPEGPRATG